MTPFQTLMESYGIPNEGQLFASRFTALKQSLGEKNDEHSYFSTQVMIEEQLSNIFARFRIKFFESFGGIYDVTEVDGHPVPGVREPCRRVCTRPTLEMRQKASAYYRMAYTDKKYLSFGWLANDILAKNREQHFLKPENLKFSLVPLADSLSMIINKALVSREFVDGFESFKQEIEELMRIKQSMPTVSYTVAQMCKLFGGKLSIYRSNFSSISLFVNINHNKDKRI